MIRSLPRLEARNRRLRMLLALPAAAAAAAVVAADADVTKLRVFRRAPFFRDRGQRSVAPRWAAYENRRHYAVEPC